MNDAPQTSASSADIDPRVFGRLSMEERDMRPIVARPRGGLSGVAIGGIAAISAIGLFSVLEARRTAPTAPATKRDTSALPSSASPPPLYVPPREPPATARVISIAPQVAPAFTPPVVAQVHSPVAAVTAPSYQPPLSMQQAVPAQPRQTARNVSGQLLVLDTSTASVRDDLPAAEEDGGKGTGNKRATLSTTRARAAVFANRSTTVPQGTLIPAVLETAFDSTSPGFARALVQKDIHGFDGARVLIPRGSRLIGEYGADTAQGQKRAVILWSRLIRPDGVTIAIGSPAADTLGRGGVKADVNSHFLERFSGAILQSALDLGVTLASRNSRSPVFIALPGAGSRVAATATSTSGADIAPTLRVPAGRSVGVFVARDLDFTDAEGAQ